jgi:beta-phosphoglucomutase
VLPSRCGRAAHKLNKGKYLIKGIVFDFDGVVVDSHPVHLRTWKKFLDSMGHSATELELQFVLEGRKREDILRFFLGELDPEQLAQYGRQKEQLFRDDASDVQTIAGLKDFLEDLRRAEVPLGIASSGSKSRVEFLLDHLDLNSYFQVVVTADDVIHGKPDPAVFLKAAEKLEVSPHELVAFEDAVSGVKAAIGAGLTCVGIARRDRAPVLLDAGACQVIEDFRLFSHSKLLTLLAGDETRRGRGFASSVS